MTAKDKAELTDEIKSMALEWADLVGIAPVDRLAGAPEGHRPVDLLPGAKSVVSVALQWVNELINQLPDIRPLYTRHMITMREMCDREIYRMCTILQRKGIRVFPIPNGDPFDIANNIGYLSLKHTAVAAGLGNFGLNNLVLTPQFGARQRFGAIITDAELIPDPYCKEDVCAENRPDCGLACIRKCPMECIPQNSETDIEILRTGVAINKTECTHYQDRFLGKFGRDGYTYRCGMCIANCPAGNSISKNASE
jgi:epoxyqueuosine reductase QueG